MVRELTAEEVFGVVVRTFGLIIVLWAVYTVVYLINVMVAQAPTGGQTPGGLILMAGFLFTGGMALLRGEWLVRLAYGR